MSADRSSRSSFLQEFTSHKSCDAEKQSLGESQRGASLASLFTLTWPKIVASSGNSSGNTEVAEV